MFKYCLIQVLHYEAQRRKKKQTLKCKDCFFKGNCEKAKESGERTNHERAD